MEEGLGMTGVIISFHKDYTDYHHNLNLLRVDCKDFTEDIQSFVTTLKEGEFKRFSLTYHPSRGCMTTRARGRWGLPSRS